MPYLTRVKYSSILILPKCDGNITSDAVKATFYMALHLSLGFLSDNKPKYYEIT